MQYLMGHFDFELFSVLDAVLSLSGKRNRLGGVMCSAFSREKKEQDAATMLATRLTTSVERRGTGSPNRACKHGDSAEVWVDADSNTNSSCC